jgi:hypothetical protein
MPLTFIGATDFLDQPRVKNGKEHTLNFAVVPPGVHHVEVIIERLRMNLGLIEMFRGFAGFFLIPQKRADGVHADLADKAFEIADQVRALVIGQSEGEAFREPAFQTGMNLFPQSVVACLNPHYVCTISDVSSGLLIVDDTLNLTN